MRIRLLPLLLLCTLASSASDLNEAIRNIIESEPAARQSFWGIRVLDAETGDVLFAQNDDKFFVPASNTKLFTSSLALRRLGPDYRFRTRVEVNAKPDATGRVSELRLIGGGDPNLSPRVLPYVKEDSTGDPLAALKQLADQVAAAGVKVIEGDVTGDDTAYLWEPFPDGWSVDDPTWEYGAPVSALTLNDNAFALTVSPGNEPGMPASLSLNPAVEYLTVHNRTRTVAEGQPARISFDRIPGSRELIVSGTVRVGAAASVNLMAINDPALFAAHAFRQLLETRGIQVLGGARAAHRNADEEPAAWTGVEVASHESAPLSQVVQVANKVSQNLHTELILRELARTKNGVGSRRAGLEMIGEYLKELGVEDKQWNFEDASGLSRLTLVTPKTVSIVLASMYKTPLKDQWMATLPTGGVDGTLEKRFKKNPAGARIHAKTGSLSHVSGLSGYAVREDGKTLVFAMQVNNYNAPVAVIRGLMDQVALALLQ